MSSCIRLMSWNGEAVQKSASRPQPNGLRARRPGSCCRTGRLYCCLSSRAMITASFQQSSRSLLPASTPVQTAAAPEGEETELRSAEETDREADSAEAAADVEGGAVDAELAGGVSMPVARGDNG